MGPSRGRVARPVPDVAEAGTVRGGAAMIEALQLWIAPVAGTLLTLWAAVVALASEANAPLPRMLVSRIPDEPGSLSAARSLHVIHLTLLLGAGAMAGAALAWW